MTAAEYRRRAAERERKALDADDAGRPLDADRLRRAAFGDRRAAVACELVEIAAIGGGL